MKLKKLLSIVFFLGILGSGTAFANNATVIKEFGCFITPAASGIPAFLFTNDTHSVQTSSGHTILKCKFDIPEALVPNRAIKKQGFACNTYLGLTNNSKSIQAQNMG